MEKKQPTEMLACMFVDTNNVACMTECSTSYKLNYHLFLVHNRQCGLMENGRMGLIEPTDETRKMYEEKRKRDMQRQQQIRDIKKKQKLEKLKEAVMDNKEKRQKLEKLEKAFMDDEGEEDDDDDDEQGSCDSFLSPTTEPVTTAVTAQYNVTKAGPVRSQLGRLGLVSTHGSFVRPPSTPGLDVSSPAIKGNRMRATSTITSASKDVGTWDMFPPDQPATRPVTTLTSIGGPSLFSKSFFSPDRAVLSPDRVVVSASAAASRSGPAAGMAENVEIQRGLTLGMRQNPDEAGHASHMNVQSMRPGNISTDSTLQTYMGKISNESYQLLNFVHLQEQPWQVQTLITKAKQEFTEASISELAYRLDSVVTAQKMLFMKAKSFADSKYTQLVSVDVPFNQMLWINCEYLLRQVDGKNYYSQQLLERSNANLASRRSQTGRLGMWLTQLEGIRVVPEVVEIVLASGGGQMNRVSKAIHELIENGDAFYDPDEVEEWIALILNTLVRASEDALTKGVWLDSPHCPTVQLLRESFNGFRTKRS
jgi:hypothetical protein